MISLTGSSPISVSVIQPFVRDDPLPQVVAPSDAPPPHFESEDRLLPIAYVPQGSIEEAESYGVASAYASLVEHDPVMNVSKALTLMDALYERGFSAKVLRYIHPHFSSMMDCLENSSQRAEFLIRVAKFFPHNSLDLLYRAAHLIETERAHCLAHVLLELALGFAKSESPDITLRWLVYARANCSEYLKVARIYYEQGKFAQGLMIWNARPKTVTQTRTVPESDFIDLISQGLSDLDLARDGEYQTEVFTHTTEPRNYAILLKALSYRGFGYESLRFGQKSAEREGRIEPLLNASSYIVDVATYKVYVAALLKTVVHMPKRHDAVKWVHYRKILNFEDTIALMSLVENAGYRGELFWDVICGVTLAKIVHIVTLKKMLAIQRNSLMEVTHTQSQGHPPYWVNLLRVYLDYGFVEEAKKTIEMWHIWRQALSSKRVDGDLWFLSHVALFNIHMGNRDEGIAQVKEAWLLQQDDWHKCPTYANNFGYFIYHFIRDMRRCPIEGYFTKKERVYFDPDHADDQSILKIIL